MTFSRRNSYLLWLPPLVAGLAATLLVGTPSSTWAGHGEPHYPDLKTQPPKDLRQDRVRIDGTPQWVLRFSNTVWNAGQGPLHLEGVTNPSGTKTNVWQRVYSDTTASGPYTEYHVGEFDYHPQHGHWHFGDFAKYELYTKADWLAQKGQARGLGTKTTFCIIDTTLVSGSLAPGYTQCGLSTQGLTVGWGDTYTWSLWEQWVALGQSRLEDGDYVLRSIADPLNRLHESPNKGGASESIEDNQGLTCFKIQRNRLRLQACP